jgi:hypothetical protein
MFEPSVCRVLKQQGNQDMTLTEVAALAGLGDRARVGVASHDATPIRLETPIPSPRTSVLPTGRMMPVLDNVQGGDLKAPTGNSAAAGLRKLQKAA